MAELFVRTATPIVHEAGTVPPRPLLIGDTVHMTNGALRVVVRTFDTIVVLDGIPNPLHRGPLEGDFSRCVYAQEV